ncbi:hypothetical protein Vasula_00008 [Pseudomonas phage vB_PpuP-Vasula]
MSRSNFERIVSTKPRRSAEAQEAFVNRKGKRNKTEKFDYKRNQTDSFEAASIRAQRKAGMIDE